MPLTSGPNRPRIPAAYDPESGFEDEERDRERSKDLIDVLGLADVIMEAKHAANPNPAKPKPIYTSVKAEIEKSQHGEA